MLPKRINSDIEGGYWTGIPHHELVREPKSKFDRLLVHRKLLKVHAPYYWIQMPWIIWCKSNPHIVDFGSMLNIQDLIP
jgi:hypothetical protein